ncbi:galactokinase [Heyndrickxia acidicola]|uniref:Galactokinase n=1 Tax=Heyndrickxia acidicola TaxID=209389 RepID=A0ABU6MG37_9BACI|nr:galactokinase [Heyndrickxia acidicola]MED1203379.1 galactokinase [Heyndrickxia acidicola]
MNIEKLSAAFKQQFRESPDRVFFSPGRINLIGEHTDYNGGHVFPCAITYGTYAYVRQREDQLVRLYSLNFEDKGIIQFSLDELEYDRAHDWANYPKGMIKFVKEAGYSVSGGFDCLIYGNIPNGAGLSSSASIELLTGVVLEGLFGLEVPRVELVKIGQRVENEFIGVNSGIMDQFAIGMGKKDFGILLDCSTLEYEYAPIHLENHHILIMNTNKRRELADSKYNERRAECEEALKQLQTKLSIQSLGDLSEKELEENRALLSNKTIYKRAKHAVSENARTIKALKALKAGDIDVFGKLMNQSHQSLKEDYEVTGKELDTLVEAAWNQAGVLGARMTGAGFGGCAIAIVENEKVEAFIANVGKAYKDAVGYEADFYVASIGNGAHEVKLEAVL